MFPPPLREGEGVCEPLSASQPFAGGRQRFGLPGLGVGLTRLYKSSPDEAASSPPWLAVGRNSGLRGAHKGGPASEAEAQPGSAAHRPCGLPRPSSPPAPPRGGRRSRRGGGEPSPGLRAHPAAPGSSRPRRDPTAAAAPWEPGERDAPLLLQVPLQPGAHRLSERRRLLGSRAASLPPRPAPVPLPLPRLAAGGEAELCTCSEALLPGRTGKAGWLSVRRFGVKGGGRAQVATVGVDPHKLGVGRSNCPEQPKEGRGRKGGTIGE